MYTKQTVFPWIMCCVFSLYLVWWWWCWLLWLCLQSGPHWPQCECQQSPWAYHLLWRWFHTHPRSRWAVSGSWPWRKRGQWLSDSSENIALIHEFVHNSQAARSYSPHTWYKKGSHQRTQSGLQQLSWDCCLVRNPQHREPILSSCLEQ